MYIMWFRSYSISFFCLSVCLSVYLFLRLFFLCRYFILRTGWWPTAYSYLLCFHLYYNNSFAFEQRMSTVLHCLLTQQSLLVRLCLALSHTQWLKSINLTSRLPSSLPCAVCTCHRSSCLIIVVAGLSFTFSYNCIFEYRKQKRRRRRRKERKKREIM